MPFICVGMSKILKVAAAGPIVVRGYLTKLNTVIYRKSIIFSEPENRIDLILFLRHNGA